MSSRPLDVTALLGERAWIARLALRLVENHADADDLAQETLVRALEHAPDERGPVRGWLARVLVRRAADRARSERARAVRERLVARTEAVPSSHELVEKAELQRALVEAVLALAEPQRTTVLLRFFENVPPREIAARTGVPVTTVNSRLQRALAALRTRLERERGRESWALALAPLARDAVLPPPWIFGASLMSGIVKVAAGLALVVAGCAWWWSRSHEMDVARSAPAETTPARGEFDVERETHEHLATAANGDVHAEERSDAARTESPVEPHAATPVRLLRGRVVDVHGRGVAGVGVGLARGERALATSSTDGSFEVDPPASASALVALASEWSTVLPGAARTDRANVTTVVVAPRLVLGGRTVDDAGAPLAGVEVAVSIPGDVGADFGFPLDFSLARAWRVRSDERGEFSFDDAPYVEGGALRAVLSGYERHIEPLPAAPNAKLVLVLPRTGHTATFVRGSVRAPGGARVADARVSAGGATAITDASGEFALDVSGVKLLPRLVAVARGFQPCTWTPPLDAAGAPVWPAHVELELGVPPLSIRGRVRTSGGEPAGGVRVWITDPTYVGEADGDALLAEGLLSDHARGFWNWIATDADGRFELAGLGARAYDVAAIDPHTLVRADVERVLAGANDVELVLAADVFHTLRGRVVARDGSPLGGVSVKVQRPVLEVHVPDGTRDEWLDGLPVKTAADGSFEFHDVPREGVEVFAWGDAILFASRGVTRDSDANSFVLRADRRVHLQVLAGDTYANADALRVLDEHGAPMILRIMRGETSYTSRQAFLSHGRSHVLSLGEGARKVVIYAGEELVAEQAVSLELAKLNTVHF